MTTLQHISSASPIWVDPTAPASCIAGMAIRGDRKERRRKIRMVTYLTPVMPFVLTNVKTCSATSSTVTMRLSFVFWRWPSFSSSENLAAQSCCTGGQETHGALRQQTHQAKTPTPRRGALSVQERGWSCGGAGMDASCHLP